MHLTPAQNYLSRLYEHCVDLGLDLDAIRLYLLSRGIPRTPAQIAHDLDHVFCFTAYASSHPAVIEVLPDEVRTQTKKRSLTAPPSSFVLEGITS